MNIEKAYDNFIKGTAQRIKQHRLKAGLSQKDMEDFGFDVKNYQKIEYGRHHFSLHTLFRLSVAFKCKVEDLVG